MTQEAPTATIANPATMKARGTGTRAPALKAATNTNTLAGPDDEAPISRPPDTAINNRSQVSPRFEVQFSPTVTAHTTQPTDAPASIRVIASPRPWKPAGSGVWVCQ